MADKKRIDPETGTETVGHEWDGIEELDTPMPRWWLWTLYATIAWAVAYTIFYPAWPLISSATTGVYNWSSREQLDGEMKAEAERKRPVMLALAQIPVERLADDSKLMNAAVQGGAAAFRVNCVQCHGSGAAGGKGYANLNDDDWLWGGTLDDIYRTISSGIRSDHPDTRLSLMPSFGTDGILTRDEIDDVAEFVLSLSGGVAEPVRAERGKAVFAANCVACHGDTGGGNREFGAPPLNDAIWLNSGDRASIVRQIRQPRHGVMPAWSKRLPDPVLRQLALYVYSLGGGQAGE